MKDPESKHIIGIIQIKAYSMIMYVKNLILIISIVSQVSHLSTTAKSGECKLESRNFTLQLTIYQQNRIAVAIKLTLLVIMRVQQISSTHESAFMLKVSLDYPTLDLIRFFLSYKK